MQDFVFLLRDYFTTNVRACVWVVVPSDAFSCTVYVPGATAACVGVTGGVAVAEPPPPHAEKPIQVAHKSRVVAAIVAPRLFFSFLFNGSTQTKAISTEPMLRSRSSVETWATVAIVTVKVAGLPPVTERLDGAKLQDAFFGKLLQVKARLPE